MRNKSVDQYVLILAYIWHDFACARIIINKRKCRCFKRLDISFAKRVESVFIKASVNEKISTCFVYSYNNISRSETQIANFNVKHQA